MHARRIAIALSSLALVTAGGVGLAPVASAADESVQFSSFASGVAVSGSMSTTLTSAQEWAEIDFSTGSLHNANLGRHQSE